MMLMVEVLQFWSEGHLGVAIANGTVSLLHFCVIFFLYRFCLLNKMRERGSQSLRDLTKVVKPHKKAK